MLDRLRRHLDWLRSLPILPFSLMLAMWAYVLRIVPAIIVAIVAVATEVDVPVVDAPWYLAIIVAPVIETLIGQWLPIALTSRFTKKTPLIIAVSTILFAAGHYDGGLLPVVIALPGALVLAWAFVVWRNRGIWPALTATALTHMWMNLVSFGLKTLLF